jgi:uncharacterized membrane protein YjjP (DUF1212 family)
MEKEEAAAAKQQRRVYHYCVGLFSAAGASGFFAPLFFCGGPPFL